MVNQKIRRYHLKVIDSDIIEPNKYMVAVEWILGLNTQGCKLKLKNISFKSVRSNSTQPPYDPPLLVYFNVVRSGNHNNVLPLLFLDTNKNKIPFSFFYDGFDNIQRYNINEEIVLYEGDMLYLILNTLSDSVHIPTTDKYYVLVEEELSYL